MQAIRTRFHGPTNTTGACIRAKCEAGSIRMSYRHELDSEANHKAACELLRAKMKWNTPPHADMVGGCFAGDWYWSFDDKRLQSLRAIVNSMRAATWSGNPWMREEFRNGISAIGRAVGYFGDFHSTPTTDAEIAAFIAKQGE